MFHIEVEGSVIGVCAAPYESSPESIQVGYILVDGSNLEEHGLGFAATLGIEQVPFNLTREGQVVYENCLIQGVSRTLYMENRRGVLLENSRIQFLTHHEKS